MDFFDILKDWFNIGGVKVKIEGLNHVVSRDGNRITAQVVLSAKNDKIVTRVVYKFLLKKTTGRGADKETTEFVIAQRVLAETFDIKAGDSRTLSLELDYSMEKTLKDTDGVLGGVGKLATVALSEQEEYLVIAQVDVRGAAISPSHRVPVAVM